MFNATKDGRLVKVDRFYPSSKTCHCCGFKVDKLPLSVRIWTCFGCGASHDRDWNATQNLKHQGILMLKAGGCTVSACGGLRKTRDKRAAAYETGSPVL